MGKWPRRFAYLLVALLGVALLGYGGIYTASERVLHHHYATPAVSVPPIPQDAASLAEGERIAILRGCTGCHDHLYGDVFDSEPLIGTLVAPNLTQVLQKYSDADLVRLLRYGVRPSGESVFVMPSTMFYYLSDADLGKLIAYLRSVAPVNHALPPDSVGLLGRYFVATHNPDFQLIAETTLTFPARPDFGPPAVTAKYGEYLARSVCTECHAPDLKGYPGDTPDLVIAKGYSREQFTRLMRTGIAVGDRDLRLMSDVARSRFSHFSDAEVEALYLYLQAR
jgi:mono/diheme cytochrome c family protein